LEVDVQQGNFKILRLLPQVLILFLVEKWNPPSRLETTEIGKKTEGILGVSQYLVRTYISKPLCYLHYRSLLMPPLSFLLYMYR
jgi:hypothetical protein